MTRDLFGTRQQMRLRIATLAARLIAQDGITDYSVAKRKAARQAGAPDSRHLPTNVEIDEAVRAYQALYQSDEHPERVRRMRELALEMMRLLESFDPHLTGSVLSGSVGRHGEIHLQLYTDSRKQLELFLINRQIPFRVRESRMWSGDVSIVAPTLLTATEDTDFAITVLSPQHRRQPLRISLEGRPLERASIPTVELLLASVDSSSGN
ncbi:MAG: hypothetical protein ABI612_20700 [Betaproteobacteria bacterium]